MYHTDISVVSPASSTVISEQ